MTLGVNGEDRLKDKMLEKRKLRNIEARVLEGLFICVLKLTKS